jgi:hypothetical protein
MVAYTIGLVVLALACGNDNSANQLHIDRPFIYLIREIEIKIVPFMGRITDPTQTQWIVATRYFVLRGLVGISGTHIKADSQTTATTHGNEIQGVFAWSPKTL